MRLGKGGFEHKDKRVGFVDTPVFVVVGAPRAIWRRSRHVESVTFLNDEIKL